MNNNLLNRSSLDPASLAEWKKLEDHAALLKSAHLRELFSKDPARALHLSRHFEDIIVDFSKHRLTQETLDMLVRLAEKCQIAEWRDSMIAGAKINNTENRAALHIALRAKADANITIDNKNVMPEIQRTLERMKHFSDRLRQQQFYGATGKPIRDIVHIGIGGSDLGPRMVCQALEPYADTGLHLHFVSNVDGAHLHHTLKKLDPATTYFLIASKTFTTQETMANAHKARAWITDAFGEKAITQHFAAISTNKEAVGAFGIDDDTLFEFWDWVGGRYSLWSAIGLPIAIYVGFNRFQELLEGARAMDDHFQNAAFHENLPVLLALIGIWCENFLGTQSLAILPYDQNLSTLPAYLQQLDMESNGKAVRRDGAKINYQTSPILWGEAGTNGQHAFYQAIHQGTKLIPCDFLVAAESHAPYPDQHNLLLANCLAQSSALAFGRTEDEARQQMAKAGLDEQRIVSLLPHRIFPGNRPSTTILYRKLTPYRLGSLIALYEHKIFVQGIIWGINSFDQWGVELGKQLAESLLPEIGMNPSAAHDSSTTNLLNHLRHLKSS